MLLAVHLNELYDLNGCFSTVPGNHLYLEDDIFKHYRFPREQILILSDLLRANLEKREHRSQAVPVDIQVSVAAH